MWALGNRRLQEKRIFQNWILTDGCINLLFSSAGDVVAKVGPRELRWSLRVFQWVASKIWIYLLLFVLSIIYWNLLKTLCVIFFIFIFLLVFAMLGVGYCWVLQCVLSQTKRRAIVFLFSTKALHKYPFFIRFFFLPPTQNISSRHYRKKTFTKLSCIILNISTYGVFKVLRLPVLKREIAPETERHREHVAFFFFYTRTLNSSLVKLVGTHCAHFSDKL